jgi:hypothetical protein
MAEPAEFPREDPFLAGDPARHERRVAVGDLLEVIDHREVHVLRQEVLADALGDVGIDLVLVEDAGLLYFLKTEPYVSMPQTRIFGFRSFR